MTILGPLFGPFCPEASICLYLKRCLSRYITRMHKIVINVLKYGPKRVIFRVGSIAISWNLGVLTPFYTMKFGSVLEISAVKIVNYLPKKHKMTKIDQNWPKLTPKMTLFWDPYFNPFIMILYRLIKICPYGTIKIL